MKPFLFVLACAAPTIAIADEPPIIVTGQPLAATAGRKAYDTVVVGRDRLVLNPSARLENVLADVAGFSQFRRSDSRSANPSAQGATLRGLGGNASSRALVLLDGVPQADPFFGYIPFNAIPPDQLGAVTVTRGGGVGPFGAGAVAGTIELTSAGRGQLPLFAARGFYGSRNATDVSGTFSPNIGQGFISVTGRWDRGDGVDTTPASQRVAATAPARYDDWSASVRAVAPINDRTEIQARGTLYRDHRTLRFVGADNSSEANDASVRLIHRGPWQVDALAYVQTRNFTNVVISAANFRKTLDQRDTPSTGLGAKIELRPPVGGGHVVRVGGDVRLADGQLFEDAYSAMTGRVTARRNAGGKASTAGVFAEDDWTIGSLILTGGIRLDRWTLSDGFFRETSATGAPTADSQFADRSGWEESGRIGAAFALSDMLSLRAAGYTGFRAPTLNELYRPFAVFPVTTRANAALDPERLRGAEAGVSFTPSPTIRLAVTGYYNRLDDAIANVTIGPNLRQRQNIDAIVARGIELDAGIRLGAFDLAASYAYTDSRVRATGTAARLDGLRPAQTPRHTGSATLAWAPAVGPALSATVRYIGAQFEDDLQTDTLRDALVVDGVARLPIGKHLSIIARAENIFDVAVETRNVAGSIDLGTPRTLWIGFSITR